MRQIIIILSIIFISFTTINTSSASADCIEKKTGWWTIWTCPLSNNVNKISVINKRMSWKWPSPYLTTVKSDNPKRDNWKYRAKCNKDRWMVDTSNWKRNSFCKNKEACIEKKIGWWTVWNCPLHPFANTEYAVNKKILWNWPSPYIKNIKSDNPKKDNWKYKTYRVKCSWERMVDTSDGKRESYCKTDKKTRYEKNIFFNEIKYDLLKASWEKDISATKYSYRFWKIGEWFEELKKGDISTNYINFDWLEQWTSYKLQVIARNGNSVLWIYNWETKTIYEEWLKLYNIKTSSTSMGVYFKRINWADWYKLDIYRIEEIKMWGNIIEYRYHRLWWKDYEIPRNSSQDCLNLNNLWKLKYCYFSYNWLKEHTTYKAKITALKWKNKLTNFEWEFTTKYKDVVKEKLEFSDIKYDSFSFSWSKKEDWINKYYYDIYDKTNNKKIITWMYDDKISYSYNTKTWKYNSWFKIQPGTTYIVTVNGYSNTQKRNKIVFSWEITTDWDNISILSRTTKLNLDKLILKVKNKYLSNTNLFFKLIENINKEINSINSSSNFWKSILLKGNYIKQKLEEIIEKENYIKLKKNRNLMFENINKDSFTIKRKKISQKNYYIRIYDKTNNKKLVSGMYEDKPLTYSYNTKTWKYNNWFKIKECTYYKIDLDYYRWETYKSITSELITKWCEWIENEIIDLIYNEEI